MGYDLFNCLNFIKIGVWHFAHVPRWNKSLFYDANFPQIIREIEQRPPNRKNCTDLKWKILLFTKFRKWLTNHIFYFKISHSFRSDVFITSVVFNFRELRSHFTLRRKSIPSLTPSFVEKFPTTPLILTFPRINLLYFYWSIKNSY